ncbi:hypothetical protein AAF712_004964 [Marasmius tenuissimus]|uniref:Cullin family profile domain-containing protein n=1 Tax=Marasmius tenuissimus TaxID=585030 RepID=A0ABR3A3I9_9AGAR
MLNVFHILELPKHGNGLSTTSASAVNALDIGSASPPRKVMRLNTDVDIATASRARAKSNGVVNMKILGNLPSQPKPTDQSDRKLIKKFMQAVLNREERPLLETYTKTSNRCRAFVLKQSGAALYEDLKQELEGCNVRLVIELRSPDLKRGIDWIKLFVEICDWFHYQVNVLCSTLAFLDQAYVPTVKGTLNIHDLAFAMFNARILQDQALVTCTKESLQSWSSDFERKFGQKHTDRESVAKLFAHLQLHGEYPRFEVMYKEITQFYYTGESENKAQELAHEPERFLKHIISRIASEVERSKDVFPAMSWKLIQETTEQSLMKGRAEWLATKVVPQYLDSKDMDGLASMYQLYTRIGQTKVLCASFRRYFEECVKSIVLDTEATMVDNLLSNKALGETTIKTAFLITPVPEAAASTSTPPSKKPDEDFVHALNDAFSTGFKACRKKPAEALAKHLDKVLRKGQGGQSDAEYTAILDSVLALYRYSDDKDVFRRFYHRQLAKRLLLGKSASDAFEKALLKKLRDNYDAEFDQAQNMFTDLALARDMMNEYHGRLSEDSLGRNLFVTVLQTSAWPFASPKDAITLPQDLQAELAAYDGYYREKHKNRSLTWDHSLGTMSLKGRFKAAPKELSVSLYQGVVLLLFNDGVELSYEEIKEATLMEDDDLCRTLQSLACGKKRVLKKTPHGPDVNDGDKFHFNVDFVDPRSKIHINSIQAKVSVQESVKTNLDIDGDRKHVIDAAVVRIMKAKKEMMFELMVNETIEAVQKHFKPEVAMIKKRIDSLVEDEYLERDAKDKNKFRYLA